jgi:hypothetical protein
MSPTYNNSYSQCNIPMDVDNNNSPKYIIKTIFFNSCPKWYYGSHYDLAQNISPPISEDYNNSAEMKSTLNNLAITIVISWWHLIMSK